MVSIGPWQYNFTSEKEQLLYNSNKNSWSQSVCYLEVSLYKELNKDSDSLVTNCKLPYYIQGTHLVATKQIYLQIKCIPKLVISCEYYSYKYKLHKVTIRQAHGIHAL